MVLVPVPWSQRVWTLSFLTALSWPAGSRRRPTHKTSSDWTGQRGLQVRRWLPERRLILVLDGGFAAVDLAPAGHQRPQVTMSCRWRLDAALYYPPDRHRPANAAPSPRRGCDNAAWRKGPAAAISQGNRILSQVLNRAFSRYSSLAAHFNRLVSIPRRQLVSRFRSPKANRRMTLRFAGA